MQPSQQRRQHQRWTFMMKVWLWLCAHYKGRCMEAISSDYSMHGSGGKITRKLVILNSCSCSCVEWSKTDQLASLIQEFSRGLYPRTYVKKGWTEGGGRGQNQEVGRQHVVIYQVNKCVNVYVWHAPELAWNGLWVHNFLGVIPGPSLRRRRAEGEERGKERGGCVMAAGEGWTPCAVKLPLRRITRICMRYLVNFRSTECHIRSNTTVTISI